MIRAESIVVLAMGQDGLRAKCLSGRVVRLTEARCFGTLQLALLEEIRRAGIDDRWAVVVMPPAEADSLTWGRECVGTLLDRQ